MAFDSNIKMIKFASTNLTNISYKQSYKNVYYRKIFNHSGVLKTII